MIKQLWIGTIPEIFGYGMSVLGNSEKECLRALKGEYRKWKKQLGDSADPETNFESSFENFGGYIRPIEAGRVYYDNFAE